MAGKPWKISMRVATSVHGKYNEDKILRFIFRSLCPYDEISESNSHYDGTRRFWIPRGTSFWLWNIFHGARGKCITLKRCAERKKLEKNAALADNATVVARDLVTGVKKLFFPPPLLLPALPRYIMSPGSRNSRMRTVDSQRRLRYSLIKWKYFVPRKDVTPHCKNPRRCSEELTRYYLVRLEISGGKITAQSFGVESSSNN